MGKSNSPRKPTAPRSPLAKPSVAARAVPPISSSDKLLERLKPVLWPGLYVLGAYVLFAFLLPTLANLTPPGVDPKAVAAWAEEQAAVASAGCENACQGMGCPTGWVTKRSPDDYCKCICARADPSNVDTPWDLERKQKEEAAARAKQQQPVTQPDGGLHTKISKAEFQAAVEKEAAEKEAAEKEAAEKEAAAKEAAAKGAPTVDDDEVNL